MSQALERRKMLQHELASILGVTPGSVTNWIRGSARPTIVERTVLFALLAVPVDSWLTNDEHRALQLGLKRAARINRSVAA